MPVSHAVCDVPPNHPRSCPLQPRQVVHGDLCDESMLGKLFIRNNFTHVAHLAGQAGVRYSLSSPHKCALPAAPTGPRPQSYTTRQSSLHMRLTRPRSAGTCARISIALSLFLRRCDVGPARQPQLIPPSVARPLPLVLPRAESLIRSWMGPSLFGRNARRLRFVVIRLRHAGARDLLRDRCG